MVRTAAVVSALVALAGAGVAQQSNPPPPASGVIVLNSSASGALTMVGNSKIEIPARAVYVNSSSNTAVQTQGNATLDAPNLYVVGHASFGGQSRCTGNVYNGVAARSDPCQGVTYPSTSSMTSHGSVSISGGSAVTLQPGAYSGISISGNSTVTFAPGVYMIGGSGLSITSGAVSGDGVSLVVLDGSFSIAGTSSLTLSPPTAGDMQGIVLCQPPSNTGAMSVAGGSGTVISGTIYAPKAQLTLRGNSTVEGVGPQMGDLVVCDRLRLEGTAVIKIGLPAAPPVQPLVLPYFD